jgi:phosphoglycerate dehydrogenase-like enzyme
MKKKVAFFCNQPDVIRHVYGEGREDKIRSLAHLHSKVVTTDNFSIESQALKDLEVIFSTWGMPHLGASHLDKLPSLKAVFYAAGSVRDFAGPLLERGITVVNASAINAQPTALFAFSQIILSLKGFFRNHREFIGPDHHANSWKASGLYQTTIAILGFGQVGQLVLGHLRPLPLKVLVVSPFTDASFIRSLGAEKVNLADAFARSMVVSNHIADLPETSGILNHDLFSSLLPGATFINTGRGRTVCEKDLIQVLSKRTDLTALLDVTHPEPPLQGSPLYSLPNVLLSSHIAGSIGNEVFQMADGIISEFESWLSGRPLRFSITKSMLDTMA